MQDRLQSDECSRYLKALGDPDRLKIVECLRPGPRSVGELCKELDARIANVSHHLGLLKQAGVVVAKKQGRFVIYELSPALRQANGANSLNVLDFGCCRVDLGERDATSTAADAPASPELRSAPDPQDALRQINLILARSSADAKPNRPARAAKALAAAPAHDDRDHLAIDNASFERPATTFFDAAVEGWVKEGDPSGTGVFLNAPDDAPFRGSRFVINADGNQLAAIAAKNPGKPVGLSQVLSGEVFEAGATYTLSVAIGLSSVQPATGPTPARMRLALTFTDDAGVRQELAGESFPPSARGTKMPELSSTKLARFDLVATVEDARAAGRPIGLLITTAPNGPEHDGHFIFDGVQLQVTRARARIARSKKSPSQRSKAH